MKNHLKKILEFAIRKTFGFYKDLKALFLYFLFASTLYILQDVPIYLIQGGNRFFVLLLFKNLSIIMSASFKNRRIKCFKNHFLSNHFKIASKYYNSYLIDQNFKQFEKYQIRIIKNITL